tara:strand:- start:178 stop:366 length:189 start_codon:yes stop_codon:yes gene_type:complete
MIIVPVLKNIDKAIKDFRYKLKRTQVIKKIRENRYYIKKNQKSRNEMEKAVDRERWNLENED